MSTLFRALTHRYVLALVLVVAVGGSAYAATDVYRATELESATVAGSAQVKTDTSASGGQAVRFGTASFISNVKIMTLGDSLTAGDSAPNVPQAYRQNLKDALNGAGYTITYVGDMFDGVFHHESLGGACIGPNPATPPDWGTDCWSINLYPSTAGWINTFQPNIVIMQGGNNDLCCDDRLNRYGSEAGQQIIANSLRRWIDLVFATKPDVSIIVIGTPGYSEIYDDPYL